MKTFKIYYRKDEVGNSLYTEIEAYDEIEARDYFALKYPLFEVLMCVEIADEIGTL